MSGWHGGSGGDFGRAYELMQERKRRNLTAMISVKEVNDIFDAHKQREQHKEANMHIKVGDRVRLKDSPYRGKVLSAYGGTSSFRAEGFNGAITADDTLLELLPSPQVGDIYRDKDGDEWVIFESAYPPSPGSGKKNLYARRIDKPEGLPRNTTSFVGTEEELERWTTRTDPTLIRRREQ